MNYLLAALQAGHTLAPGDPPRCLSCGLCVTPDAEIGPCPKHATIERVQATYTPPQVAEMFGTTRQAVVRWIRQEKLVAVRQGRDWQIPQEALEGFERPKRGGSRRPNSGTR
jgi:excisionase family DNA binding protein